MDQRTYHALPDAITAREVRFHVPQAGFRTRSVVVATTLPDPEQATPKTVRVRAAKSMPK